MWWKNLKATLASFTVASSAVASFTAASFTAAVLLICLTAAPARAQPVDPDTQLEDFLQRLQLTDLQLVHLENQVDATSDPGQQLEKAKRLADLYALRLASIGEDQQKYNSLVQRVNALLQKVPDANTVSLQVLLLKADWVRADALISKWALNRGDTAPLQKAQQILAPIAPRLTSFQLELNTAYDKLIQDLQAEKDAEKKQKITAEIERRHAVTGRASYYAGWANYELGVTRIGQPGAKDDLQAARAAFRRLLQIETDEEYKDLDAGDLQLQLVTRARTVVGLAQTETALGDQAAARTLFALLDHATVSITIRDQAAFHQLTGYLNARQLGAAVTFAAQVVKDFRGTPTQGKVSFCAALLREGFLAGTSSDHKLLARLGVQGMTSLRQFGVLQKFLADNNITLKGEGGFINNWLQGQQELAAAEKSKIPADYEQALATFEAALKAPGARQNLALAAECRTKAATCLYRLNKYAEAARMFEAAAPALKSAGGDAAVNALWSAFMCHYQLRKKSKDHTLKAVSLLQQIQRDYADHAYAKKAAPLLASLNQAAGNQSQAINKWEAIKPSDPQYATAQSEIAAIRHKMWREQGRTAPAARTALDAIARYLEVSASRPDTARQLAALTDGVEIASHQKDTALAAGYLSRAAKIMAARPMRGGAAAKYHYFALQAAQQAKDNAAIKQHATWIQSNAAGTAYEGLALIMLAKDVEAQIKAADTPSQDLLNQAVGIYSQMAQQAGQTQEILASDANARIATTRLASYEFRTGRYDLSARHWESLLAAYPKDKRYLREAARAFSAARQHEKALPYWRTLSKGLENRDSKWFEAKFHHLNSLSYTSPDVAGKAFAQFRQLYPTVKDPAWSSKFKELERRINAPSSAADTPRPQPAAASTANNPATAATASQDVATDNSQLSLTLVLAIGGALLAGVILCGVLVARR